MNIFPYILIIALHFISTGYAVAQEQYEIEVGKDSSVYSSNIDSLMHTKRLQGYHDIALISDTTQYRLHLGKRYSYGRVVLDTSWYGISRRYLQTSFFQDKPLGIEAIKSWSRPIFRELSYRGYPLARITPHDIQLDSGKAHMMLSLDRGDLVVFDTLHIVKKGFVNASLVSNILGIKGGKPYDERLVQNVRRNLQNNRYYALRDDPYVKIVGREAQVNVFVEKLPSSRFDFIIGVLPTTQDNVTKYTISGDLLVETRNILDRGEYFYLNIKRLSRENQSLKIAASYPYIFSLPYTVQGKLDIEKNAQNYLNVHGELGVSLRQSEYIELGFSTVYRQSSLVEIDTQAILRTKRLPRELDTRFTGVSANIRYSTLDNIISPREGIELSLNPQYGRKRILANEKIRSLQSSTTDFSMAYDSLSGTRNQGKIDAHIDYYLPINTSLGLHLAGTAGVVLDSDVLRNEMYRIGGYRLLRGFEEQSIYTDHFYVVRLDNRFFLGPQSYLSLPFIDYSYYRSPSKQGSQWHSAIGFGLGLAFQTSVGILNISFALGKKANNPIDFNQIKVHFGYVSTF